MLERLPRFWRNTALGVLGLLILWFCWTIRSVVNPLLLGYLFAYILHPLVEKFEARGMKRRTAVNLIFALGFLLFIGITFGLAAQTKSLVTDVVEDEKVRGQIAAKFDEVHLSIQKRFGEDVIPAREDLPDVGAAVTWLRDFLREHQDTAQAAGKATVQAAGGVFNLLKNLIGAIVAIGGLFILVPLYTYYMLFELGRVHGWVKSYLPVRERERIAKVGGQMGEVLANFFRGRLVVCLLKGTVIWIGLWIAQIPYAFLFGMLGGFLSVIPFIGPLIGFVGAFIIGVLDHSVLGSLVRTGIVFGLAEVLEGYVLIPKVLGDSLGLHPLVVLFVVLAGGAALGMFGVLISLPVTAALVILFKEFVLPALKDMAEEGAEAPS